MHWKGCTGAGRDHCRSEKGTQKHGMTALIHGTMRALLPENGVPWAEEQPKFLKTGAVWHSSVCWFLQCKKYAVSDTANRWRVKQKRFFMRYIMKLESICNGILHIIRVHEGSAGVWTKSWQITAEKYCTQWAGKS